MSSSLNTTLITLEALMKRFGVGEASANAMSSTNAHPFNIVEYRQTVEQMTALAQELNSLVTSVIRGLKAKKEIAQVPAAPGWLAAHAAICLQIQEPNVN